MKTEFSPAPAQHTPGPWHAAGLHIAGKQTLHRGLVCHHPVADVLFLSAEDENDIERSAGQCFVESPGERTAEANARLIAEVPNLLSALIDLLQNATDKARYISILEGKDGEESELPDTALDSPEMARARAAIARATGRAAS